ncbi:hypothetical protein B1218_38480, partial [Pseudomonas ogarae]
WVGWSGLGDVRGGAELVGSEGRVERVWGGLGEWRWGGGGVVVGERREKLMRKMVRNCRDCG